MSGKAGRDIDKATPENARNEARTAGGMQPPLLLRLHFGEFIEQVLDGFLQLQLVLIRIAAQGFGRFPKPCRHSRSVLYRRKHDLTAWRLIPCVSCAARLRHRYRVCGLIVEHVRAVGVRGSADIPFLFLARGLSYLASPRMRSATTMCRRVGRRMPALLHAVEENAQTQTAALLRGRPRSTPGDSWRIRKSAEVPCACNIARRLAMRCDAYEASQALPYYGRLEYLFSGLWR